MSEIRRFGERLLGKDVLICRYGQGDYLVRNGHDPPVDLDDPLIRASCAFCARGGICGDGVCSGEIFVISYK